VYVKMISKPLLGIIADIHDTAVGILLMLIKFIENDLIAKKRSYYTSFSRLSRLSTLSHSCLPILSTLSTSVVFKTQ
jgi:hypothetical protein